MNRLEKQERLFAITQLAKAIFIEKAKQISFTQDVDVSLMVAECFIAAEQFLDGQEAYAKK
jgi:hypothetical protein